VRGLELDQIADALDALDPAHCDFSGSSHGDQLASTKPRGTARFLSDFMSVFICDALETDWLAGAAKHEKIDHRA
jgi:hypothetical protein